MSYAKTAFALFALAGSVIAADPFAGTWKLNVAKSKYKTGAPNKEGTIVIAESGNDLDINTSATSADGSPISVHYTIPAKGGEGRIVAGPWEAVSGKRPGANQRITTFGKGGKVLYTVRSRVSADGKIMTTTVNGTNAAGKQVAGANIYEKQ